MRASVTRFWTPCARLLSAPDKALVAAAEARVRAFLSLVTAPQSFVCVCAWLLAAPNRVLIAILEADG